MVKLINWQLKHLTSKDFQKSLRNVITLGQLKAEETLAQAKALEAHLKNSPGMNPVTGEIQENL